MSKDLSKFDHNEIAHRDGIEPCWQAMREASGLARSEEHGGYYIVSRYTDVAEVTRNHRVYSSAQGIAIPALHFGEPLLPIEADPPLQSEIRRIVLPFLSKASVAKYEPFIRDLAISMIEAQRGQDEFDFADVFALPFPSMTALHFLQFPREDARRLDYLINTALDGRGTDAAKSAAQELDAYLEAFLARWRKAEADPENIVSNIAHGRILERPLNNAEQLSITRLLLFGGFTTTTFALTSALRWLANHPDDWARLRADPGLIAPSIDEFVRFASPGAYLGRTVTGDAELSGCPLHKGDKVLVSYGSANRDPAIFENPEQIVLARTPNPHMGFGYGTHACIGLHLARLELRVALEELTKRLTSVTLGPVEGIRWSSGETQGMSALPLRVEWGDRPVCEEAAEEQGA